MFLWERRSYFLRHAAVKRDGLPVAALCRRWYKRNRRV